MRKIGIGHAKPRQDNTLEVFHLFGRGVGIVVMAEQMEKSMHREMRKVISEQLRLCRRLSFGSLITILILCPAPAQ